MRSSLFVQLSILGVGAFLGVRSAIPCSLIAPSETAGPFGTTGAQPLLIKEQSSVASLLGPNGEVPVDPVEPDPRIAEARGAAARSLSFFKPRTQLAPGEYTFDNGRVMFTVSDPAAETEPGLSEGGGITINVHKEQVGCGGVSSCGDFTSVQIGVLGMTMGGTYLVELETDDGDKLSRLVSERNGFGSALLFYGFEEIEDLEDVELCAKVTAVKTDGTLGKTVDAGCAEAK